MSVVGTNSKSVLFPHTPTNSVASNRIRLTAEGQLLLCLGQENSMTLSN